MNEHVVDLNAFRRQRAEKSYDKAIECGSYWLAACIAASHILGEDKVRYAAEREYESAMLRQHFH